MKMLKAKLLELEKEKMAADIESRSGEKRDVAWGSQIRSYVLDDRRVKDHRTGLETGNPERVLDGDLQAFIEAELRRKAAAKKKA